MSLKVSGHFVPIFAGPKFQVTLMQTVDCFHLLYTPDTSSLYTMKTYHAPWKHGITVTDSVKLLQGF